MCCCINAVQISDRGLPSLPATCLHTPSPQEDTHLPRFGRDKHLLIHGWIGHLGTITDSIYINLFDDRNGPEK